MRAIDADELKEAMLEESDWWENADVWVAHKVINQAPTVEPVKRGKWGHDSDRPDQLICSVCNKGFDMWHYEPKDFPYCPRCGAKMDGDKE